MSLACIRIWRDFYFTGMVRVYTIERFCVDNATGFDGKLFYGTPAVRSEYLCTLKEGNL